ncbi:MAG: pyridoxine 5'-phosphate synthase [Phycisphaeraceae bacterium]
MIQLGVNIDHVATIRQARKTYEPDPVWAAAEAQLGGADGITVHLREDRRHIQDHDVERIKTMCHVKLNLEMAATDEMVAIACRIKPQLAMLVPEGRLEVTTEGGLDVAGQLNRLRNVVKTLRDAGMAVSAFIDAERKQVEAAAQAGFSVCEIHTGPYAHAFHEHRGDVAAPAVKAEIAKVAEAGRMIVEAGMQFNAGHALNYVNVSAIAALPGTLPGAGVRELHIGHAIISHAIFVGLRTAVREMKELMIRASAMR